MLSSVALARECTTFDVDGRAPVALRASFVREPPHRYEDEGSVREARGSASVGRGVWWSAALVVPIRPGDRGDVRGNARAPVLVRLERHGALPGGAAVDVETVLVVPSSSELDAIVVLLGGVIAQARHDGVLDGPA
jgi:hypothetical protein